MIEKESTNVVDGVTSCPPSTLLPPPRHRSFYHLVHDPMANMAIEVWCDRHLEKKELGQVVGDNSIDRVAAGFIAIDGKAVPRFFMNLLAGWP